MLFCFGFIGINPSFIICYNTVNMFRRTRIECFVPFLASLDTSNFFFFFRRDLNNVYSKIFQLSYKIKCSQILKMIKDALISTCWFNVIVSTALIFSIVAAALWSNLTFITKITVFTMEYFKRS